MSRVKDLLARNQIKDWRYLSDYKKKLSIETDRRIEQLEKDRVKVKKIKRKIHENISKLDAKYDSKVDFINQHSFSESIRRTKLSNLKKQYDRQKDKLEIINRHLYDIVLELEHEYNKSIEGFTFEEFSKYLDNKAIEILEIFNNLTSNVYLSKDGKLFIETASNGNIFGFLENEDDTLYFCSAGLNNGKTEFTITAYTKGSFELDPHEAPIEYENSNTQSYIVYDEKTLIPFERTRVNKKVDYALYIDELKKNRKNKR